MQFPDFRAADKLTRAERDRAERTQAVTFVGKLARHADESLVTHDANEAAYLAGAYGKAGRFLSHCGGAACLVRYTSERKRSQ